MRVRLFSTVVIGASLFLSGCGTSPAPAPPAPVPSTVVKDPHSFANADFPYIVNVHLDLTVDFAKNTLRGTAQLKLEGMGGDLVLDTRGLTIRSVTEHGKPLPFSLGATKGVLGAPLTIAARWHGVYAKHPTAAWVEARPAPGVLAVTGVGEAERQRHAERTVNEFLGD